MFETPENDLGLPEIESRSHHKYKWLQSCRKDSSCDGILGSNLLVHYWTLLKGEYRMYLTAW